MPFINPFRQYGDTRSELNQVDSLTGRTLQQDMNQGGDALMALASRFQGNKIMDGDTSFRMPLPRWAPGEFEEWKQAKMTGMPTTYGANADRNFRARKIKAAGQQLVNPALMALMQGIR